jgi:hypothetical protein
MGSLTERFLSGENCVLFSYGMTNSGKTYTIQGTSQAPGLLPQMVHSVLDRLGNSRGTQWDLQISMLEIYQEKIFDLMGNKKDRLLIRDTCGRVEVVKLSSHPISTVEDAMRLLDTAASKR